MMRFYCPQCWNDFGEDHPFCPCCGHAIHADWERKTWVDKVIHALDHPEPRTVLRATEILGRIQDVRAVDPLIRLAQNATDVFVLRGAVEALAAFDLPEVHRQLLSMAMSHPARMVRQVAQEALKKKGLASIPVGTTESEGPIGYPLGEMKSPRKTKVDS